MDSQILDILTNKFKIYYFFLNEKFEIIDYNNNLEKFIFYDKSIKKLSIYNMFPELSNLENEIIKEVNGINKEFFIPKINREINNQNIYYDLYIIKYDWIDNNEIKYLCLINDVTLHASNYQELKQSRNQIELYQRELLKINEELRELIKLKDNFFSIVSHDLRTPFTSIIGFLDIMLFDDNFCNDKDMILKIKKNAENQLKFINDILYLLKLNSGKIQLNRKKFNIKFLINYSLDLVRILAQNKNIDIIVNIKDPVEIDVDYEKIVQVLNNLISNAIKFTPKNGKIRIDEFVKDNYLEIHIIDNGIGINPEDKNKLFDVFTNYHKKGTENEAGSGLGLSICKKFIELHNGIIDCNSEPGKGSDFFIKIPINNINS